MLCVVAVQHERLDLGNMTEGNWDKINAERLQAYINLINTLLNCSSDEEINTILNEKQELIDSGLRQIMVQEAEKLAAEGNQDHAEFLFNLANQLANQDYLQFLMEVLQATSDSNGNPEVIYPLLQDNLDKLDDNLAHLLRTVVTVLLSQMEIEAAGYILEGIGNFSNLLCDFPYGNQANNIKIAIAGYEAILTVITSDSHPENWAEVQYKIGIAYWKNNTGDRVQNLELAVDSFEQALTIYTREVFSYEWASIHNYLGNIYREGYTKENLEFSLELFEQALTVLTSEEFPIDWAKVQKNIGDVYSYLDGDRRKNIELAIEAYRSALEVLPKEEFSYQWAAIQNSLGNAYSDRIAEEKAENLEFAIEAFEQALQVFTPEVYSTQWATVQNNLGTAYWDRMMGDRRENLELAIKALERALQVRTPEKDSVGWATTQINLGLAFWNRIEGKKAENLESAIKAFELALKVYTREEYSTRWAIIQNNLGNVYRDRIIGDRKENLEFAIEAFKQALGVRTLEEYPNDYAVTQNNIGIAYKDAENLELAVEAFNQALKVHTRQEYPDDWAAIQNNLGNAYVEIIEGDRKQNLELAIKVFQGALEVYTQEDFSINWAMTQNCLGKAYSERIKGDKEENLQLAVEAFTAALMVCTRETLPYEWATTVNDLGIAYRDIAYRDKVTENKKQNLELATASFKQALEFFTPETLPVECLKTSRNLGNLAFIEGDWQPAIDAYQQAITAVELSRSWAINDQRRQEIIADAIKVYQKLVQAYINTKQSDKAIETVERSKARNLVELLTNRDLDPKGDVPPEIIGELHELRRNIPSLEGELQVATDQLSGNTDEQKRPSLEESRKRLQQELQESRQQLDELLKQINDRYDSSFTLTQKVETIPFKDIQSLIDERTAIIEWYLTEDEIITFIVTSHDRYPIVMPSSRKNLEILANWHQEYLNAYNEQKSQWINNLFTRLTDLAQILNLDSILSEIDAIFDKQGVKCNRLILIPHRFLHLFPLHALPLSNSNEELLLDRFERGVSYAPSSQLLKLTKQQNRPNFQNLFAIQNPTRPDEKPLLGSKLEVDKIRQYFDPNDSIILAEAEATEANLNQNKEQLRSAHCLHFSCHGKFKFESPLESALLLSDPEGKLEADADLTLYKIFKLDLSQCRIVSFSACESGMTLSSNKESSNKDEDTALPSGLDEYIGLPSGFLYAGSPSVVSALWTVDPLATALLVIKFYKNLKRLPTLGEGDVSTALVKAQFWLRTLSSKKLARIQKSQRFKRLIAQIFENNKRDRGKFNDLLYAAIKRQPYPFAKPYYWAASVATGT